MTEFEKKRLKYFIKAAEKGEWVQLGKGDAEIFMVLLADHEYVQETVYKKVEDNFMDEF